MDTFTEITIKGMVCNRCVSTIEQVLKSQGYPIESVALGKVKFKTPIDFMEKEKIMDLLSDLGFELLSNKNEELLADIKSTIEEWVESLEVDERNTKLSEYLAQNFNKSYEMLREFYSKCEGITIEKYFIGIRINKVKKLLLGTSYSLSEIAFITGFNSPHHLSSQFKNSTGLNPSELRRIDKAFKKVL